MIRFLVEQGVVFSFNKQTAGFVGYCDGYEDWRLVKGGEVGDYADGVNLSKEELVRV